jgi:hypothetical protein
MSREPCKREDRSAAILGSFVMNDTGTFEAMAIEQLRLFFADYGVAFTNGDLSAIARCYALPTLVLSDAESLPVTTIGELETAFRNATAGYRPRGLETARPALSRIETLSAEIVSVDVDWDYLDAQGNSAARERFRYLLRVRPNDDIRIQVVIAQIVS